MSLVDDFKRGIFSLNTRRFGNVAELMIQAMYDFDDAPVPQSLTSMIREIMLE